MTWLRLQLLVIGYNFLGQFFDQWEAKPKPIASCWMHYFSPALSKWQVIARNSDWLIAQFAAVVIGRSNCYCIGFSTVISKVLWASKWSLYVPRPLHGPPDIPAVTQVAIVVDSALRYLFIFLVGGIWIYFIVFFISRNVPLYWEIYFMITLMIVFGSDAWIEVWD